MKSNSVKKPRLRAAVFGGIVTVLLLAAGGTAAFAKLRALHLEQSVLRNPSEQISVTSGRMVRADVVTECFGLKPGVNLNTIDYAAKRADTLRQIPNLRNITVTRRLPDKVSIVAEERLPVACLAHGRNRTVSGRVVDREGVVFNCRRGTQMLPIIREASAGGTAVGQRIPPRALAALLLIETCQDPEFADLGILEVSTAKRDYLLATLGDYSRAKIAWPGMDEPTPESDSALRRQLSLLAKAIRSRVAADAVIWNATDASIPGRIYADTQGKIE